MAGTKSVTIHHFTHSLSASASNSAPPDNICRFQRNTALAPTVYSLGTSVAEVLLSRLTLNLNGLLTCVFALSSNSLTEASLSWHSGP